MSYLEWPSFRSPYCCAQPMYHNNVIWITSRYGCARWHLKQWLISDLFRWSKMTQNNFQPLHEWRKQSINISKLWEIYSITTVVQQLQWQNNRRCLNLSFLSVWLSYTGLASELCYTWYFRFCQSDNGESLGTKYVIITRLYIWQLGLYGQNYPCPLHWVKKMFIVSKKKRKIGKMLFYLPSWATKQKKERCLKILTLQQVLGLTA